MERRLNKARAYFTLPRKWCMNECRHASVRLLDGESLEITVLPRITVEELLTVVSSHSGLRAPDRHLFGLAFVDEHNQYHWLTPEKRLIDAEVPPSGKGVKLRLCHNVKFFVPSVSDLVDISTVQLFFLDAQQQLARELLELPVEEYIRVASLLLHIFNGDFIDRSSSEDLLRAVLPLPRRLLLDSPLTPQQWTDRVVTEYSALRGHKRGTAIILFMEIVERSSTYGSRFYRVRNSQQTPFMLALNSRGVLQYDKNDLARPLAVFFWRHIDNIYYRECHFSIEVRHTRLTASGVEDLRESSLRESDDDLVKAVHDPTTQVSLSRRRGSQHLSGATVSLPTVHIYTFVCDSPHTCKALWSAAIAQHQFHLEQRTVSKRSSSRLTASGVDHVELCERLNRLVSRSSIASSLPSLSSLHSSSLGAMPAAKVSDGSSPAPPPSNDKHPYVTGMSNGHPNPPATPKPTPPANGINGNANHNDGLVEYKEKTEADRAKDLAAYKVAVLRKKHLEKLLTARMAELREICIKEGEMTGEMPSEMKRVLRPGEEAPKLKRRIGTTFQLSADFLPSSKADKVQQMESEVEVHRKIVAAAERLAKDKSTNKSVRKKRQKDLLSAANKLRGLELSLNQVRLSASKPDVSSGEKAQVGWSSSSSSAVASRLLTTKSAPTTPRGSVPDLAVTDNEDEDCEGRPPSCSSVARSLPAPSGTSSSSLTSSSSVSLPLRGRPSMPKSLTLDAISHEQEDGIRGGAPPPYESVGYRSSASYKSSYRQVQYPTLHETLRKRAKSEHALEGEMAEEETEGRFTVRQLNAWQYEQSRLGDEDEERTPVVEERHFSPSMGVAGRTMTTRLIPSSQSCQAGFATASLDRKALRRQSPTASPSSLSSAESASTSSSRPDSLPPAPPHASRDHSPAPHRITTFPVNTNGLLYKSSKPLDRLHSAPRLPSLPPPSTGSRPPYALNQFGSPVYSSHASSPLNGRLPPASSLSTSKLPAQPDSHMEALLEFYRERHRNGPPKTATIV